ncbi:MAG: type II toxin-antitoxin system RelE/ParE family toxin [Candidatus Diapherotrites archaeon]|uniref:Type II toxin-antitoxin system RelE/ParE family toxin n=1 Tax=Candidatus Iainarchaeum sp. TaxID=3101447 RepID=A0A938YN59_9ARCH|nr:type II toxin-antitoxin system RelE/ParE family toxin [Candidatus Diapherotrites archaeon]
MFLFEVRFNNQPKKAIKKLDEKMKKRLHSLFLVLEIEPVPAKNFDLKKIAGSTETYRVRLGHFRVEYFVEWQSKTVFVLFVKRRKERTYKRN